MQKILVTRKMPPAVEDRLAASYDATFNASDEIMTTEQLLGRADGMDGLLICPSEPLSAETIGKLPDSVKIVVTFSVGHEHVALAAARDKGLVVTNTPDVLNNATADITMLCLLGAARRAHEGETMVRNDQWEGFRTTMLLGTHVSGKPLGIVGMGRIGQAVARRARGFDMKIHYFNRTRLTPDLEAGATYHGDAQSLFSASEFLSINCPSSSETRHLLNADSIGWLPDGAVVVNTARGDIVNDSALIAALKSGKIAAAGLDVYDGEPALNPAYRSLKNTFLMPHLGSATVETRNAMGYCCCDNLDAYFAGKPCPTALT